MYLIETNTLTLKWFSGSPPPYAILSHTWGSEEVSFVEFSSPSKGENKVGLSKIKWTCEQARLDGLGYAWVDTCCINKESSSELGEAINSMYRWYSLANICYAYIEDLPSTIDLPIRDASVFKACRWFSRGWTLQELIAPVNVEFFAAQWTKIGSKQELYPILEQITGIPRKVLIKETLLGNVSVADRMNWAAERQTSREEDIAYCLMGIFDVNMPMMYGEGEKAFLRLQDEIIKQTQDDSLFSWRSTKESASKFPYRGLLASSPKEFASIESITPFPTNKAKTTNVLGGGRVSLNCVVYTHNENTVLGLKCYRGTDLTKMLGIEVISIGGDNFLRTNPAELTLCSHQKDPIFKSVTLERYTQRNDVPSAYDIYTTDGVYIASLPQEISVCSIHSTDNLDSHARNLIPIVHLIGKKTAFELAVSREASGVDVFEKIGWSQRDGVAAGQDIRLLLTLWVEQGPMERTYKYCFNLEKMAVEDTAERFISADRQMAVLTKQAISVGWAVISAAGSYKKVGGHEMFNFDVGFAEIDGLKAEAKTLLAVEEAKLEEQAVEEARRVQEQQQKRRASFWKKVIGALVIGLIFIGIGSFLAQYREQAWGGIGIFVIIGGLIPILLALLSVVIQRKEVKSLGIPAT